MKIVKIVPGAGGTFYCQNCMRDIGMVRALRKKGHDVTVAPMYLPILVGAEGIGGDVPVFFGGINVYLQQRFAIFRKTPRWLDRLLDRPWILRHAAAREGTTEAAGLGPMTLSMLQGKDGHQRKELERLVAWLAEREKPDIVHLSNALLLGLASELKRALGVPVLCTLQDEEPWLDAIDPPYSEMCWQVMSAHARDVDQLIAVSRWYGDEMAARMRLDPATIRVVPLGIDAQARETGALPFDPPVIGYLSKMTDSLGLGLLVDAFIELKRDPKLANLKLRATGGMLGHDVGYVAALKEKLARHGFAADAEFVLQFDATGLSAFARSLTVMCVPSPHGEAFGLFILEALAAGVPVVQPDVGGYPEVVEATGGGLLYDHRDPAALKQALAALLLDPDRARELGRHGQQRVRERFDIDRVADELLAVYEALRG